MKLNNELNNMSWRVRADEVLLEVGRLYGSKMGLQKLNVEVYSVLQIIINLYLWNHKTFTLIQRHQSLWRCLNLSTFLFFVLLYAEFLFTTIWSGFR